MQDKRSFESVYREYHPRVFRFVLSKVNNERIAEDLAQETMVACYRNYSTFDPKKASITTWVFVAARNKLKNFYRDRRVHEPLDHDEIDGLVAIENQQEQAILFEETCTLLRKALEQISERERQVITKKYYEEMKSAQIARELDMTAQNVRVLQKRTLAKIRLLMLTSGYQG